MWEKSTALLYVFKTKDPNSNLIQIVSRSVRYSDFLTVSVARDTIFNEVCEERMYTNQYIEDGSLRIIKKPSAEVQVEEGNGALKLLSTEAPLIHFDFEEITPLSTRQVIGLSSKDKLILSR